MKPFLIRIVFILTSCVAAQSNALTLQEAIHTTFEKNPKMQANEKRLEEIRLQAKVAWMDMFPSISLSLSRSHTSRDSTSDGKPWVHRDSDSGGSSVGAALTLFDPSRYYRARAADANVKQQTALANSTNTRNPDTKGGLATSVQMVFTLVLTFRQYLVMISELERILQIFLGKAETTDEKNRINESLNNVSATRLSMQLKLETQSRNFLALVTTPVPEILDGFDEVISSLRIPPTREEALEIAREKSPDLLVRNFAIDRSQELSKAQKSGFLPKIYLESYKSGDRSASDVSNSRSKSTTTSLTLRWGFDLGQIPRAQAADVAVAAAMDERDGVWRDLELDMEVSYNEERGYAKKDRVLMANLRQIEMNLSEFLKRIERGEKVDLIKDGLGMIQSYSQTTSQVIENKSNLIDTKFLIQRKIGTLFEAVDLVLFGSPSTPQSKSSPGR